MQGSGQTVLRTWAYSEKFGSDALQPGPYQINERVAEALDWVIYQVKQSKPNQCVQIPGERYYFITYVLSWILLAFQEEKTS